jgi:hypothetical protein
MANLWLFQTSLLHVPRYQKRKSPRTLHFLRLWGPGAEKLELMLRRS